MQKKAKTFLILGIVIFILGVPGTYGLLLYNAASQIEVDIEHIYITSLSPGGTLLNPTMDLGLEIHAQVSNPTAVAVSADFITFDIYLEGEYFGEGNTTAIRASQVPSTVLVNVDLLSLGGDVYLTLASLAIPGNSLLVTITITGAQVVGIHIQLDQSIDTTITAADIL
jgi:hypothetical protein